MKIDTFMRKIAEFVKNSDKIWVMECSARPSSKSFLEQYEGEKKLKLLKKWMQVNLKGIGIDCDEFWPIQGKNFYCEVNYSLQQIFLKLYPYGSDRFSKEYVEIHFNGAPLESLAPSILNEINKQEVEDDITYRYTWNLEDE